MQDLHSIQIEPLVRRALEEDWGYGDWTTDLCVSKESWARAKIVAKEDLLVAGVDVAKSVFQLVDSATKVRPLFLNGDYIEAGTTILEIEGPSRSILKSERVALNFMMRMCGIASLARKYVKSLEGTKVQLLDTRKTTPGLRLLEKSATMLGGARNHRFGLCDGVMVKENHIRASGGITQALASLLDSLPPTIKVEVETSSIEEVREAVTAGADIIMLDNMSIKEMRAAVECIDGRALVEASGNIQLDNLRDVAETGVDFVSTSAIITQASWSDLSLLFEDKD